ncbi:MAG: molybdopterin cofactor-binding domain-containing protein [Candidatus Poribacteria bacterium]
MRCRLPRVQHSATVGNRTSSVQRVQAGASQDGRMVAFDLDSYGTGGWQYGAEIPAPYLYTPENWTRRLRNVYVHAQGGGPIRAQRHAQASWGMERTMDDLADELGLDPLAMRLTNDTNPRRHAQFLRLAQEIGWDGREGMPSSGPVRRGLGIAGADWDNPGNSAHCAVQIAMDSSVTVFCGTEDLGGTGSKTPIAVIATEELGLPVDAVVPRIGDTRLPYTSGSGGATGMASVGPAVKVATSKALGGLFRRVGQTMRIDPARMKAVDGEIRIRGLAGKSVLWAEACGYVGATPVYEYGLTDRSLAARGVAGCCGAGCCGAEVEVDAETGSIRVVKMVSIQDCGLVVNRAAVEDQIVSAMVMGISFVLLEERVVDPIQGSQLNANFGFYKIATSMDIGELIPIVWMERNSLQEGIKGVGEAPPIPVASAIGNAVKHALGVAVNRLPMTPRRVLEAVHGI